jgi:hypothetical protein
LNRSPRPKKCSEASDIAEIVADVGVGPPQEITSNRNTPSTGNVIRAVALAPPWSKSTSSVPPAIRGTPSTRPRKVVPVESLTSIGSSVVTAASGVPERPGPARAIRPVSGKIRAWYFPDEESSVIGVDGGIGHGL